MMSMLKKWAERVIPPLKKHPYYTGAAVLLIILAIFFILKNGANEEAQEEPRARAVEQIAVSEYSTSNAAGIAVPTAGGSFVVRAEAAGRVTRVVSEGSRVAQGAIVAELENSAQRAALTQAQGAYEAALASQGGTATSREAALTEGIRVWKSSTVSAADVMRTSVDELFGDPRSGAFGLFIEGFGEAPRLVETRRELEKTFDRWEEEVTTLTAQGVEQALSILASDLATIGTLIDDLAALAPRQPLTAMPESERIALVAELSEARSSVTALERSVDGARTAIKNSSGSSSSLAEAQVKQALGAYQAAQAAYNKTFVRVPFSGRVTAASVTVGDIISIGSDVALVVPDKGVPTEASFALPLSAVKFTPAGAYVFTVDESGALQSVVVKTGLVTANAIITTGLSGSEFIVKDVRGLKAGERVESQ